MDMDCKMETIKSETDVKPGDIATEIEVKPEPIDEVWNATVERNEIINQTLFQQFRLNSDSSSESANHTQDSDNQLLGKHVISENKLIPKDEIFLPTVSLQLVVLLKDVMKCEKCQSKLSESNISPKRLCRKCNIQGPNDQVASRKAQCSICLKFSKNRQALSSHKSKSHNPKKKKPTSYKCSDCDQVFKTSGLLAKHRRIHKTKEYFKCDLCSLSFLHKSNLERHINVKHISKNNFEKVKAPTASFHSSSIKRRLKCDLCPSTFKEKISLYRHSRIYHGIDLNPQTRLKHLKSCLTDDGYLQCKDCGRKFPQSDQNRFSDHEAKHKGKTRYKCPKCEKTFPTLRDVEEHQWRHTGIKPYKCGECEMTFPREINLQSHLSFKHRNEIKFGCDVCGQKFNGKYILKRHMLKHNKEGRARYKCDFCDQSFLQSDTLLEHMEKRMDKVFKCGKCDKKYCNQTVRLKHLKDEHNIFECYVCGKHFSTCNAVVKHRTNVH